MSFLVADTRSRGRSKSPGGRDRSRSRDTRAPSPPEVKPKKSKKYYESDSTEGSSESDRDRRSSRRKRDEPKYEQAEPKSRRTHEEQEYQRQEDRHRRASSPGADQARGGKYIQNSTSQYEQEYRDGRHSSYAQPSRYEYEKPAELTRHASYTRPEDVAHTVAPDRRDMPGQYKYEYDHPESREKSYRPPPSPTPEHARHLSMSTSGNFHVDIGHGNQQPQYMQPVPPQQGYYPNGQPPPQGYYQPPPTTHAETYRPHSTSISSVGQHYAVPEQYQYAQPPHQITYISKTDSRKQNYVQTAHPQLELEIEVENRRPSHSKPEHDKYKTEHDKYKTDHDKYKPEHDDHRPSRHSHAQVVEIHPGGPPSLNTRMHSLSVSGTGAGALTLAAPGHSNKHSGAAPPGSPLLEAYHGTYQSISPMPSPMALPLSVDDGLSDLEPLEPVYSSDDSQRRRPKKSNLKKRVSIYDPEPDALALAASLKHSKPDPEPIIDILPKLSDDNMMQLRTEYKKHIKVGGKGINIAKHIKLKVPGNLGKVAYATALGRWESEAHWANFWYQSGTSRRELLIESLMGRSNIEIRKIKEAFSDKRYNDSLEKCMQTELKKDKFRNAVLLALEEKRMDELTPLSKSLIRQDAQDLYRALVSKDGGETAMIEIIVVRSDTHLREVLKEFEGRFERNFAREMIQKSRNLVGEVLAHILNGVLNRPVRDALLIHQALAETSKDRTELLISRLVRVHWEPKHLERVKVEYKRKYGSFLDLDVEEGTKGDFGEFCLALCQVGR